MEKQQRNRYTEEFKKRTVFYILEQTKTVPQIAEELGISAGVLHNWKQLYRSEVEASSEHQSTPDRIRQLELQLQAIELEKQMKERENADLQEELQILKKALHIFGKERN
jgi:transposase